jgi:hypothetical protein
MTAPTLASRTIQGLEVNDAVMLADVDAAHVDRLPQSQRAMAMASSENSSAEPKGKW